MAGPGEHKKWGRYPYVWWVSHLVAIVVQIPTNGPHKNMGSLPWMLGNTSGQERFQFTNAMCLKKMRRWQFDIIASTRGDSPGIKLKIEPYTWAEGFCGGTWVVDHIKMWPLPWARVLIMRSMSHHEKLRFTMCLQKMKGFLQRFKHKGTIHLVWRSK